MDERPPQNWFNQQVERRLDTLAQNVEALWKELREEVRRGDGLANTSRWTSEKVEEIRRDIETIRKQLREEMMTREDFRPYKNGLIMVISTVGVAVIGAVLKLVIGPQ